MRRGDIVPILQKKTEGQTLKAKHLQLLLEVQLEILRAILPEEIAACTGLSHPINKSISECSITQQTIFDNFKLVIHKMRNTQILTEWFGLEGTLEIT